MLLLYAVYMLSKALSICCYELLFCIFYFDNWFRRHIIAVWRLMPLVFTIQCFQGEFLPVSFIINSMCPPFVICCSHQNLISYGKHISGNHYGWNAHDDLWRVKVKLSLMNTVFGNGIWSTVVHWSCQNLIYLPIIHICMFRPRNHSRPTELPTACSLT